MSTSLDVYPHPTAIKSDAITLDAGRKIVGQDNTDHGKVFFIVKSGKMSATADKTTDRRVLLRNCRVTMTPRPGNVPKQAVPSKDGVLPDATYQPYEKLQMGFKLQPEDAEAFREIEDKLKKDLFERREAVWPSNWERISSVSHVDAKMTASGPFVSVKEGVPFIYPDVVGWTDKVTTTRVRPNPRGTGLYVSSCDFTSRRVGEVPPKNKFDKEPFATNFRMDLPDGSWTDAVPLTADGLVDSKASWVLSDGVPVMRYVGPGDITEDSVCDVVLDLVGVKRTDAGQITFLKTATIVKFKRAPPKARSSYAAEIAAAAEEDPTRASAVAVLAYFKAQREAADAAPPGGAAADGSASAPPPSAPAPAPPAVRAAVKALAAAPPGPPGGAAKAALVPLPVVELSEADGDEDDDEEDKVAAAMEHARAVEDEERQRVRAATRMKESKPAAPAPAGAGAGVKRRADKTLNDPRADPNRADKKARMPLPAAASPPPGRDEVDATQDEEEVA